MATGKTAPLPTMNFGRAPAPREARTLVRLCVRGSGEILRVMAFSWKAITLKFPAGEAGPTERQSCRGYRPHPFMKCFSNRRFDRSAPSPVSMTDFALLTGS